MNPRRHTPIALAFIFIVGACGITYVIGRFLGPVSRLLGTNAIVAVVAAFCSLVYIVWKRRRT